MLAKWPTNVGAVVNYTRIDLCLQLIPSKDFSEKEHFPNKITVSLVT